MLMYCVLSMIHTVMNEYDLGHVMLSLWYPTLAVRYYFFTENVSILMSFVKEDADVDYISLDLHLIKCTLISVWNIEFVSYHATLNLKVSCILKGHSDDLANPAHKRYETNV